MKPIYKKPFVQFVKKAHKPLRLAIEDEVEVVCADPGVGEPRLVIWPGSGSTNSSSTGRNT